MGIIERLEMPEKDKFIARSEANAVFCLEVLERHGVNDFFIGMNIEEKELSEDSTGIPIHYSWNRIREYNYHVIPKEAAIIFRKTDPYFYYVSKSNLMHYIREKTFIPDVLDIEIDMPEKDKEIRDSEKNIDYCIELLKAHPVEERHGVRYVIGFYYSKPLDAPNRYRVCRSDWATEHETHQPHQCYGLWTLEEMKKRRSKPD
ncbi:MAG: hypothetical protein KAT43_03215 [Nanoarchaeota archaeon]|nr:hypothetical protein [Nanoarchaeota archaeon]